MTIDEIYEWSRTDYSEHVLGTHDFANAIVRPIEERFELRLAAVVTGTARENHVVIEESFDQRRVIPGVEECFVFAVIQHCGDSFAFKPDDFTRLLSAQLP